MGSLAILAKQQGHQVSGCDQGVYPPMSTQLESQGIVLTEGFGLEQIDDSVDMYVIGNAISRGNPLLEEILNLGLPYTSGPALLADTVLQGKWVLGVSGTHGKTTTSSMLAWILDYAGMQPGFLIGGIPKNFDISARLGDTPFFVIEADEYDSAFFDKRSKFVHYRPRTFIVNNLEFDHADIFDDLAAIQKQFHHVIRTVPSNGCVIYPANEPAIDAVLEKGCWSDQISFGRNLSHASAHTLKPEQPIWHLDQEDGSAFTLAFGSQVGQIKWNLSGVHNVRNGVAAMLAARHVGVELHTSAEALSQFEGVKRRMECLATVSGVSVYDDFAHHPTAIETTLDGLRKQVGQQKIIALIEPRSNTMRMGVHQKQLLASAEKADQVIWANLGGLDWLDQLVPEASAKHQLGTSVESLIAACLKALPSKDEAHIVVMSNGGFAGIHGQLVDALKAHFA